VRHVTSSDGTYGIRTRAPRMVSTTMTHYTTFLSTKMTNAVDNGIWTTHLSQQKCLDTSEDTMELATVSKFVFSLKESSSSMKMGP
jgi:hypothetical protein